MQTPIFCGIVDLEKTVDGWRRRLLAGILCISKCNAVTPVDTHSNECP
jgi:hypothetical protein